MCSSRSQRVKCVMSPSAATAPVTSLVTTRKRSSLWWRPTTTSFVENRSYHSIDKAITHQQTNIRKVGSAVVHGQSATASSTAGHLQRVAFTAIFLPAVPARQTDKQLQQACDLLLCRPWLEIAMSNTDCRHERRKHVNKPHKHLKLLPYPTYSFVDSLSFLPFEVSVYDLQK